jgi:Lrp/AsnC family transcriptional regulator for asnA, asnC and gidA
MSPARAATAAHPGAVRVDGRDEAIIAELQRDGRASFAAIGRAVGMSEPAVRQRVYRLVRAGVMQVIAVIEPRYAVPDRLAVIGIRCAGDAVKAADMLSAMAELHRVALTGGAFDVLAEAACADDGHLLELIQRIRGLPQVDAAEVFVALRQCLPRRAAFGLAARRRPPTQP